MVGRRRYGDGFARVSAAGDVIATSSVVLSELWYEVAKSQRPKVNAERITSGPMVLTWPLGHFMKRLASTR
jgi:hypothetical protein